MSDQVSVSARHRLVIPKSVLDKAALKPGQRLVALVKHGQITLVPVRPVQELRGFAPDLDTDHYRDEEDQP